MQEGRQSLCLGGWRPHDGGGPGRGASHGGRRRQAERGGQGLALAVGPGPPGETSHPSVSFSRDGFLPCCTFRIRQGLRVQGGLSGGCGLGESPSQLGKGLSSASLSRRGGVGTSYSYMLEPGHLEV